MLMQSACTWLQKILTTLEEEEEEEEDSTHEVLGPNQITHQPFVIINAVSINLAKDPPVRFGRCKILVTFIDGNRCALKLTLLKCTTDRTCQESD